MSIVSEEIIQLTQKGSVLRLCWLFIQRSHLAFGLSSPNDPTATWVFGECLRVPNLLQSLMRPLNTWTALRWDLHSEKCVCAKVDKLNEPTLNRLAKDHILQDGIVRDVLCSRAIPPRPKLTRYWVEPTESSGKSSKSGILPLVAKNDCIALPICSAVIHPSYDPLIQPNLMLLVVKRADESRSGN